MDKIIGGQSHLLKILVMIPLFMGFQKCPAVQFLEQSRYDRIYLNWPPKLKLLVFFNLCIVILKGLKLY